MDFFQTPFSSSFHVASYKFGFVCFRLLNFLTLSLSDPVDMKTSASTEWSSMHTGINACTHSGIHKHLRTSEKGKNEIRTRVPIHTEARWLLPVYCSSIFRQA